MASEVLTKTEYNCTTGETTITPLTAEEIADLEKLKAEAKANREAEEARQATIQAIKDSAKAKLIAGEPLTEEEAATIVL